MATSKSIKNAVKSLNQWEKEHPHASLKESLRREKQFVWDALEVDVRLATLPSVLGFVPKTSVDKIQRMLDLRKQRRYRF